MEKKRPSLALITNPYAGRGGRQRAREVARFCEQLGAHGRTVEVLHTAGPGDAATLAARAAADGAQIVIASGVDGTINEVLQGLLGTASQLAIWPAGTANVLAHEITMPFDAELAADVIARGAWRRIHAGCAIREDTGEKRFFLLMAGIGLDASVVRRVKPQLKRRIGEAAFWYSGLEHLASWQPELFSVEIDDQSFPATFAAVGKSPHYGGGLAITPRARLEAAEFEVCIVSSHSRLRYLRLLTDVVRGAADAGADADVCFQRATRVRAAGQAFVQADGELIGQLPMTFEIAPATIDLIVPPALSTRIMS
ncbi:MAG: YegS/Rv2252/BmrU family lipid kinase [Pyrinomonadaceae bacterium]